MTQLQISRNHPSGHSRHTAHIPHTMPAAAIDHFGGPEVLTLHNVPVPSIDEKEVLIGLDTAGVGPWDADIREGWYPGGRPRFPLVLGVDGAGVIAAVGSRVRRLKVGDKVYSYSWANPKGGFYAEYVAVAAEKVAHVPKRLDLEHAGAIATTGLTALQGIDDALRVKRGETVLIHGGSGGVGTLAIQFAKLRGARVIATGSGLEGVELVREMGADLPVDGTRAEQRGPARSRPTASTQYSLWWVVMHLSVPLTHCDATAGSLTRMGSSPSPRNDGGSNSLPTMQPPAFANSSASIGQWRRRSSRSRSPRRLPWPGLTKLTSIWPKDTC